MYNFQQVYRYPFQNQCSPPPCLLSGLSLVRWDYLNFLIWSSGFLLQTICNNMTHFYLQKLYWSCFLVADPTLMVHNYFWYIINCINISIEVSFYLCSWGITNHSSLLLVLCLIKIFNFVKGKIKLYIIDLENFTFSLVCITNLGIYLNKCSKKSFQIQFHCNTHQSSVHFTQDIGMAWMFYWGWLDEENMMYVYAQHIQIHTYIHA